MRILVMTILILSIISTSAQHSNSEEIPSESKQKDQKLKETSSFITEKAWKALYKKNYEEAFQYADKCIEEFFNKALQQQASLTDFPPEEDVFDFWALNDVATSFFIKGRAYFEMGQTEEAKKNFKQVIDIYSFSQCWDPRGWFWKVAQGAKIQLDNIELGINFGETSSSDLTVKAWEFLDLGQYETMEVYIGRCIQLFDVTAWEMQCSLKDFALKGEEFKFWALNDVATCYFIKGKALAEQGENEKAKEIFQYIINHFAYAQCWDPRGWFWKVAQGAKNEIDSINIGFDFGNNSSSTLTAKAWKALEKNKYRDIGFLVNKCLKLYDEKAKKIQTALEDFAFDGKESDYWALNDVASCLFIKGMALRKLKRNKTAKIVFQKIIKNYGYAQCWDPRGWFWKVAQGAKNEIDSINLGFDFGDYSSETLTIKAWKALEDGKYNDIKILVWKCHELYGEKAKKMQDSLTDYATDGKEFDYWALNDVATSFFILGRTYYVEGKNKKANKIFNDINKRYNYAQCWDPRGWFWKLGEAAKDQILLLDNGIDFGDYTSQTLTVKAWKAFEKKDYRAAHTYAKKCITLYKKSANEMQKKLDNFLPKEKAFDVWALNDVGTCTFIIGDIYLAKKEYSKAIEAYQQIIENYFYAQCWNINGWFWKPSVAARARISKIRCKASIEY